MTNLVIVVFAIAYFHLGCQTTPYKRAIPRDRTDFTRFHESGFPLNIDPKIISASEANLADDDLIMGAVINGDARAYPVNYMNGPYNEVVNDHLGDLPIAPSW
ncbi:DUF3179 domain-containing protein [Candidatus Bathyarchaeota archaeon]|jgi:hypothetical protein|nr:DUF3179 domain-containing protein [Candidatus Bathyarchaeota archaeon]